MTDFTNTPFAPSSIELVEMRLSRALSTRVLGCARTLLETNGRGQIA